MSDLPIFSAFVSGLPTALLLAIASVLLAVVVSVPLKVLSTIGRGAVASCLVHLYDFVKGDLPGFFMSLLLVCFLTVELQVFPIVSGSMDLGDITVPTVALTVTVSTGCLHRIHTAILSRLDGSCITKTGTEKMGFSIAL